MVSLADGRKVQVEELGDPDGVPALWFHGAFSSRLEAAPLDAPARELGVRLLSLDRAGVGGSDPLPGRTAVGYAADVAEVLDALDLDKVAVGGLSNGGMYAMCVASVHPERVLRAVPVNPSTPVADPAARAALSLKGRISYRLIGRQTDRIASYLTRGKAPGRFASALNRRSNPDAHLADDPAIAAMQAATLAEVLRQPVREYLRTEVGHCTGPWGFDHRAVSVPVTIVSGDKDGGLGYARVWARELPQGRLVTVPGGHGGMPAPAVSRRVVELLAGQP